jgi:hypothetical protein
MKKKKKKKSWLLKQAFTNNINILISKNILSKLKWIKISIRKQWLELAPY